MTGNKKKNVIYFLNRPANSREKFVDSMILSGMFFIISENFMGTLCKCQFY